MRSMMERLIENAHSILLRRIEGFERPFSVFGGKSNSSVLNRQANIFTFLLCLYN
jgi:hypothetical protein